MKWGHYLFVPLIALLWGVIVLVPSLFAGSTGRISLDAPVATHLFDRYDAPVLLVFFGYTGCADACPPRLQEIASIYERLGSTSVQPLFVSLIKELDEGASERFAHGLHPAFHGITADALVLRTLRKEFDVYIAPSLTDAQVYDHTTFLYVLRREETGYHLRQIYTYVPFVPERIAAEIQTMMNGV